MRKTLLWSSNEMVQNYTPITLSQNIESFDEIHYYGSALRMGNTYINNVTEYPVVPNRINLGGPYVVGMWDNSLFLLNNGTQCWLSGTSGYINSSYFWGQNNVSTTTYIGALNNNRYQDLRPYKIVGINYESSDDRTVLWSSTGNIYNTGITLSEPIQNFKEIEIYASGEENSTYGTHLGKIRFETEDGIIGCDCYGYSPWVTGYNYILGSDFKLYKNRGYCGSSYYMGMANNTTAWAAGKWIDGNAIKMLQPYKIIGVNRLSSGQITPDTFNVSVSQQTGGTVTVNKSTGYFGDVVTLSNTPSTDYDFNSYSITGASLTGNQFSINASNVTAKGSFTQKTYTLTLQTDGHGKLVANKTTGHKNDTITLTPTYSSYYRFNNYSVTGGSVNGNTFTITANATAKANFKVNAFTASGGFEKGSNTAYSALGEGQKHYYNVRKYATTSYRTSNVPSAWYATSNRWNPSNASAYKITVNPKMSVQVITPSWGSTYATASYATLFNNSYTNVDSPKTGATSKGTTGYLNYNKSNLTASTQNTVSISSRITLQNGSYASVAKYCIKATYSANRTTGTWVATGYAP